MRAGTKHVLALLLTAVLIAAACGGSDGGSEDDAGADTSPPTSGQSSDAPLTIDRSGRFSKEDTFCGPAAAKDKEAPKATDPGITADEIVITHLRVTLEQLAGIGFAVDIGDTADQSETFVKIINERCGGIHGRKLKLNTIDFPALPNDADVAAQRDCIRTAEDQKAVIAYSFTGAGGPLVGCLTGAHDVIFLTTYAITATDIEQSEGRLFSVSTAPSEMMRYAVEELAKDLKGKRIGVVYQDTTGDPQIVQQGMLAALKEKGLNVVRADVLGCNNQPRCTEGLIPSVQGMVADKVDVIFPLLNTITLPGYMAEMVTQGVKPKQFQFMNVGYFAQDGELVSGKIIEFGGKEAGELYDGAIIVSAGRAGAQRLPGYEPPAFSVMCNREYAENSAKVHTAYDYKDDLDSNRYGATSGTCTGIRLIARAIDAAGVNPTRKDIAKAMANLGAIDLSGRVGSFTPEKTTGPVSMARVAFRYPCPTPVNNKGGNCMVPLTDYKPFPKIK
jgi:ABC-type branched-subunit amino acid transport system substrate-binding protein